MLPYRSKALWPNRLAQPAETPRIGISSTHILGILPRVARQNDNLYERFTPNTLQKKYPNQRLKPVINPIKQVSNRLRVKCTNFLPQACCGSTIRLVPLLELPEPPVWIMDRKQYRRALDVRLVVESASAPAVSGRTRDLSDGGFGATFTRALRLGEVLKVSFLLGSGRSISVEAVVRYIRGFRHGLEFREISRDEKVALWRMCRKSERVH